MLARSNATGTRQVRAESKPVENASSELMPDRNLLSMERYNAAMYRIGLLGIREIYAFTNRIPMPVRSRPTNVQVTCRSKSSWFSKFWTADDKVALDRLA